MDPVQEIKQVENTVAQANAIQRRAQRFAGIAGGRGNNHGRRPVGFGGGPEFRRIRELMRHIAPDLEIGGERVIQEIGELLDRNGDGKVDNEELDEGLHNNDTLKSLNRIHPMLAKALADPNFRIRKIERKKIKAENPRTVKNQVETVQQGYAGFMDDVNKFNVDFN